MNRVDMLTRMLLYVKCVCMFPLDIYNYCNQSSSQY